MGGISEFDYKLKTGKVYCNPEDEYCDKTSPEIKDIVEHKARTVNHTTQNGTQLECNLDNKTVKVVCIGGAPTRATTLPTDGAERKKFPVGTGVLDYFPDALVAVSAVSYAGNEQHNPGKPLHWDRSKSADESDTMIRHFLQRGTMDTDGHRHSAKMVWRALAILQKEIEAESKEKN